MGSLFSKARKSIKTQTILIKTAVRGILAGYLYNNEDDADEIKQVVQKARDMIASRDYDTEDAVHEAIQKVIDKFFEDKPLYVRVAIQDALNAVFELAAARLGEIDEDNILSPEEKRAWLDILDGIIQICDLALQERKKKNATS